MSVYRSTKFVDVEKFFWRRTYRIIDLPIGSNPVAATRYSFKRLLQRFLYPPSGFDLIRSKFLRVAISPQFIIFRIIYRGLAIWSSEFLLRLLFVIALITRRDHRRRRRGGLFGLRRRPRRLVAGLR
jgi:hypothetical protein